MALAQLPERAVRAFDRYQQEHAWLAHPVGVIRKYADDRGSAFAGLVTFQVFLGMLPLLVVVLTLFGVLLEDSEELQDAVLESTLRQFPVIGDRIREDISTLRADGVWLAIAAAGLLWTATGIYNGLQLALNQVWNVPGVDRQGFVSRALRALILFVVLVAAAIGTAVLRGSVLPSDRGAVLTVVTTLVSAFLAVAMLLALFRIVVAPVIAWWRLLPAAVLAGLMWELLQRIGTWIVTRRLAEASDLYGTIGLVIVTLAWINLLARAAIFANEWAVVSWRGLWPRAIAQPPLTEADRRVLEGLVANERRRPEEHIEVRFEESTDRSE